LISELASFHYLNSARINEDYFSQIDEPQNIILTCSGLILTLRGMKLFLAESL